jgi:hypothetical protein
MKEKEVHVSRQRGKDENGAHGCTSSVAHKHVCAFLICKQAAKLTVR